MGRRGTTKKVSAKQYEETLRYITDHYGKRRNQLLCKRSKAESHFSELLDKTSYYYIREKCCYDGNGNWVYIDFYLPCFKLGIEIDGVEHNNKANHARDVRKENFLNEERNIKIYRITNEECLKMTSVDIPQILEKVYDWEHKSDKAKIEILHNLKRNERDQLAQMQPRANFDVHRNIYAYCKTNDKIYHFRNLFDLKRSILMRYKDIIRAMNDMDNIYRSNTFIYGFDEESLKKRIDEYYEFLWSGKKIQDDGL